MWYDTEHDIFNMKKSLMDKAIELRQGEIDAVQDFRGKVVEMLEDEHNRWKKQMQEQKDALKEQQKAEKDVLQAQKEALKNKKEEYDYERKILDIRKSIEEISSELGTYKYDDSSEGIQRRLELEKQLTDKQQELKDVEYDHLKQQEKMIDKMVEAVELMYEAQIAAIEAQINQEVDFKEQADAMIQANPEGTYQRLLEWNREYGTSIDADITNSWLVAKDVIEDYNISQNGVLNTLNDIANKIIEIKENSQQLMMLDYQGGILPNYYCKWY